MKLQAKAFSIFDDDKGTISKMFSTHPVASQKLMDGLTKVLTEVTQQYMDAAQACVLQGGDPKSLVPAARLLGESSMAAQIISEIEAITNGETQHDTNRK